MQHHDEQANPALAELFKVAFNRFQEAFSALGFVPDSAFGPYGMALKADEKPYAVAWCYPPAGSAGDVPAAAERSFLGTNRLMYEEECIAEAKENCEINILGCIGQGRMCSDAYLFKDEQSLEEALSYGQAYGRNRIERGPLGVLASGLSPRTVACATEGFDETN